MDKLEILNLILVSFISCIPTGANGQGLNFQMRHDHITLYEDQNPRFSYQVKTKAVAGQYPRANYVHPLYSLSGEVLTEDFPSDHLHQRGIFWSWHQLYVDNERLGDPWECEGITWIVDTTMTETHNKSAVLQSVVNWLPEGWQTPVLREDVLISYSKTDPDHYELDFEITLTALVEGLQIGGSEDEKGYGGFSARLKIPDDIQFFSHEGEVTPQKTPVEAGGWVNVKGSFHADQNEPTGVVIMCDPDALKSFRGWILRRSNSMQNPAFPGRKPLAIPKSGPSHFRNKLIVYRKSPDRRWIEKRYKKFINQ